MTSGHRQYEAAVLLAEAGLHAGVPFTLFAEIETDPLKDEDGKFVERQYLGELGTQDNPRWIVITSYSIHYTKLYECAACCSTGTNSTVLLRGLPATMRLERRSAMRSRKLNI